MSKLLFLKEWITLEEAAEHLSTVFSEPVTIADLYRFALAGHLTLSANFVNHGYVFLGKKIAIRDGRFKMIAAPMSKDTDERETRVSLRGDAWDEFEAWLAADESRGAWLAADEPRVKFVFLDAVPISAHECVEFESRIVSIDGIWDLAMLGGERLDIEHALQGETGGPPVDLTHMEGAFMCKPDGTYAQLLEHFEDNEYATDEMKGRKWNDPDAYYPANTIPEGAPLVVRPSAIAGFVAQVSGTSLEKPLGERERTSLLCIIGALAKEHRLDLSQPYKAGEAIAAMLPGDVKLGARTIGDHLKGVCEAIDSRTG